MDNSLSSSSQKKSRLTSSNKYTFNNMYIFDEHKFFLDYARFLLNKMMERYNLEDKTIK